MLIFLIVIMFGLFQVLTLNTLLSLYIFAICLN